MIEQRISAFSRFILVAMVLSPDNTVPSYLCEAENMRCSCDRLTIPFAEKAMNDISSVCVQDFLTETTRRCRSRSDSELKAALVSAVIPATLKGRVRLEAHGLYQCNPVQHQLNSD